MNFLSSPKFLAITHRHFKVHKPARFVSQFVNNAKRKKGLLGDLHDFPAGTMSIGRLDANSEGLLLLTTNGKVSHHVCSSKIEKEYHVMVDGIITDEALEQMQKGVEIGINGEKYMTKPGIAFRVDPPPSFPVKNLQIRDERHGPTSWVGVIIREGKYRQVRKMTAAVGFPTLRLIRVRIGNILLNDMQAGEWEEIDIMDSL